MIAGAYRQLEGVGAPDVRTALAAVQIRPLLSSRAQAELELRILELPSNGFETDGKFSGSARKSSPEVRCMNFEIYLPLH